LSHLGGDAILGADQLEDGQLAVMG
jgi:hypothetical protein